MSPKRKCAICAKPVDPANDPFCSDRCRQVDLNRWLSGSYAIPGDEAPSAMTSDEDLD